MALFKEKFDHLFKQLPEPEKKSLLDYMEYLVDRSTKQAWDSIPEVDEPLSEEEKKQLANARKDEEYVTLEELKRELDL